VGVPPALVTVAVNVTDWPNVLGLADEPTLVLLAFWFTVWVSGAEVLGLKLLSPPYTAVIEWLPTASALVENVAGRLPWRVRVPSVVEPSLKVTVPVGVPPVLVTVAVNVTDWVSALGFTDDTTVVVVAPMLTVCVSGADVLGPKFVSPP